MKNLCISLNLGIYARIDENLSANEVLDLFLYGEKITGAILYISHDDKQYDKLPIVSSEEDIDKLFPNRMSEEEFMSYVENL